MTTETSTIPPDDHQRNLTLARPNEDQKLPNDPMFDIVSQENEIVTMK